MPDYPVREVKMFRGALYGTVDLGVRPDKTRVAVTVKVPTSREDVASALEPLRKIMRKEAELAVAETAGADTASEARLKAQKELAQRITGMTQRGAMPDEIAKALKPIADR